MLSHKHKFIFAHIAKTAGSSIEDVLLELHGGNRQKKKEELLCSINSEGVLLTHMLARSYLDFKYVSQKEFNSYFKFAFVRNPWARMVSMWKYRQSHGKNEPFNFFIEFAIYKMHKGDSWFMQQYDYTCDIHGKQLLDFIGRFENLQDDFDYACGLMGIKRFELPQKNKTKHQPYQEYYTKELKNLIKENYRDDVELLGYEF